MGAFIRTYAGRIAGALAGAVAVLVTRYGLDIDPEALAGLEAFLEALILGAGLLVYGLVHQWINGLLGKGGEDG